MSTASTASTHRDTQSPRKQSVGRSLVLSLGILVLFFAVLHLWRSYHNEQLLQAMMQDLDKHDPLWRFEQHSRVNAHLKPQENGAYELVELLKLSTFRETIPISLRTETAKKYTDLYTKDQIHLEEAFLEMHPNARLPASFAKKILTVLDAVPFPEVLQRARGLQKYQRGHYEYTIKPLLTMTLLPDIQGGRSIANILGWDTLKQIDQRKPELVIENILGTLGIARTYQDDPFVISQMIRAAISNLAARQAVRLLAHPLAFRDADLLRLQTAFEKEEALARGMLAHMLRSERAVLEHDLKVLGEGKISLLEVSRLYGIRMKWSTGVTKLDEIMVSLFPEMLVGWGNRPQSMVKERLDTLRFYQAAIAWSQQPEHELVPSLAAWEKSGPFQTSFVRNYHFLWSYRNSRLAAPEMEELRRLARVTLNHRANLRAVQGILACERYRLEHGSLPSTWEELMPKYLQARPVDPYTGQPMVLKNLTDGLVIYSVGQDGKDDGGMVLTTEDAPARDLGFRLWNLPQRGINLDEQLQDYVKRQKSE